MHWCRSAVAVSVEVALWGRGVEDDDGSAETPVKVEKDGVECVEN